MLDYDIQFFFLADHCECHIDRSTYLVIDPDNIFLFLLLDQEETNVIRERVRERETQNMCEVQQIREYLYFLICAFHQHHIDDK